MTATAAITGYGTTLQLSDGAGAPTTNYTALSEVRKIAGVGLKRDYLEATNLLSPNNAKEFIAGIIQAGEVTFELNYLQFETTQADLLTNLAATSAQFRTWRVVLPNFGATTATLSSIAANTVTTTGAHGWLTCQPVTFTNSGGALPTGIVAATTYWIRVLTTTTFKVFASPANASANTSPLAISGGSGTNTINGTTIASFSAATAAMSFDPQPDNVLTGSVTFAITGTVTVSP